jgi:hypothetical protein
MDARHTDTIDVAKTAHCAAVLPGHRPGDRDCCLRGSLGEDLMETAAAGERVMTARSK